MRVPAAPLPGLAVRRASSLGLFLCSFLVSAIALSPTITPVIGFQGPPLDRRSCWKQVLSSSTTCSATAAFFTASLYTRPARAASHARVKKQPGLEYLEPLYELQLSIQALSDGVKEPTRWPSVQERLDRFFGGGLFSERNFYGGLAVQYLNQIEYDTNAELKEYIRLDREARFTYMEDALNSLETLRDALSGSRPDDPPRETASVTNAASDAMAAIDRWFALVPEPDRRAVADLYTSARQVDQNRDGRLDPDELANMEESTRELWKRRIKVAGG